MRVRFPLTTSACLSTWFSYLFVCSFAGSNFPAAIFPSMVGRPILRSEEKVEGLEIKDIMVGDEAAKVCP